MPAVLERHDFFKRFDPLPSMPRMGLGTWGVGESPARRRQEVTAMRAAIDMGYQLIDTAEMYGDGGAEETVGEALTQALRASEVQRGDLLIASKVYPHNARSLSDLSVVKSIEPR